MTRVLLAGDHFVRNGIMRDALAESVGSVDLEVRELVLPWPLTPFGPVAEVVEASGSEDEMISALDGVEICLTQMAPFTERVLASAPALKLVCVGRGGPVNVNLSAASASGVSVCFAPGRNATATAEHTVALILSAVRAIPQRDAELRRGQWRSDYYQFDAVGPELSGATVGVVGFGAIGQRVARIMHGFGAEIVVFDPYADEAALAGIATAVESLPALLERSLVVTLHARATSETAGLIGPAEIESMRPGSILVNAARGSLVDYEAVCDALADGHLRAAAFDVFPAEPLPADSRLLSLPNAIVTPHLAGASQETAINAASMMAEEVRRYLAGEPLAHTAADPR